MEAHQQGHILRPAASLFAANGMDRLNGKAEDGHLVWKGQALGMPSNGLEAVSTAVLKSDVPSDMLSQAERNSTTLMMRLAANGLVNGTENGLHAEERQKNGAANEDANDRQSIKMEELDSEQALKKQQAAHPLVPEASTSSSTALGKNSNAEQFLNFELEEDHKYTSPVKMESRMGSRSRSTSPTFKRDLKDEDEEDLKPKAKPGAPRSIAHLPCAEVEAMSTFEEIPFSSYQNKQIGLMHQQEDSMVCECSFDPKTDNLIEACGEGSGCINRLTQVECLADECRCKSYCRNQRFQKREYAPIEIVKTEKKGFGMRAKADLSRDDFIYEYVGDIIGEKKFQQRMKDYFDDGVEHFYFMMLQNGEFIDATRRGGKGRFLNHSCAPNCYVAKWVVGRKIRMGIFAKRKIMANEELTFNYNVDRYGHEAQECYCGEPNCVGFIGGKTQTDIAGMDDLYLEALGITEEVEKLKLKGSKKRKSRKLDEDFIPNLTPIPIQDVPKVASAVRQASSNRRIITKLLARIIMTEDTAVQRQIMRLHGFSLMSTVLHEFPNDIEVIVSVLSVLRQWPLITRNKLISTNIESNVLSLADKDDVAIANPAKELLDMWQALEIAYRIPKSMREAIESGDDSRKREAEMAVEALFVKRARIQEEHSLDAMAIPTFVRPEAIAIPITPAKPATPSRLLPANWQAFPSVSDANESTTSPSYICLLTKAIYSDFPTPDIVAYEAEKHRKLTTVDVKDIIAQARAEAEAKATLEAANIAAALEAVKQAKKMKRQQKEAKESATKEKRMYRLFSTVVVTTMSKFKKHLDPDQFKRRAKEVCEIMCEKEKKSSHFHTDAYDSLSSEREAKLKKYVKEFITKLLARKGIKSSSTSSTSKPRPSSTGHHKNIPIGNSTLSQQTETPSADHPPQSIDALDEDNDMGGDNDDLINELVQDATGGSETPDSAKTPLASSGDSAYISNPKSFFA